MMKYWQVKVKVKHEDDKGKIKTTTEQYLVDAISPTDAEAKVHQDFENEGLDFKVSDIKETKILKVIG
jgi:hypothetical protein